MATTANANALVKIRSDRDDLLKVLHNRLEHLNQPSVIESCLEHTPQNPLNHDHKRELAQAWRTGGNMYLVELIQAKCQDLLEAIENKTVTSTLGQACAQDICGLSTNPGQKIDKRNRMYHYLCALSSNFLWGVITCSIPFMADNEAEFAQELKENHHIQHVSQGIYYNTLVRVKDGRGHSFEELEKLVNKVEDYANCELPTYEVIEIDRSWLTGDNTKISEATYHQNKTARYRMNDSQKKQALDWADWQYTNVLKPARHLEGTASWKEPRDYSFCEIGWAKAVAERSAAHVSHCGTNSVWGLITAVNNHLFDKESVRKWEIRQYTICKVMEQGDANMCEAIFSELGSSYVWDGGANPKYAGGIHKLDDFEGKVAEHWGKNIRHIQSVLDNGIAADDRHVDKTHDLFLRVATIKSDQATRAAKINNAIQAVEAIDCDALRCAAALHQLERLSMFSRPENGWAIKDEDNF